MTAAARAVLVAVRVAVLGAALVGVSGACRGTPDTPALRVAAASDLTHAFEEIARDFTAAHHVPVSLTFGATGALATQLKNGAPYDVFAAADRASVDGVVAAGVCAAETRALYARGRLSVLLARTGGAAPRQLSDLAAARVARIAIASPDHAPYGRAARQALERAGLWEALQPRTVIAENVRQAAQFVTTQNVEAAIVSRSLALAEEGRASFVVDAALHDPIEQVLVVCARDAARAPADAFAAWVLSAAGQAVLRRHGLEAPAP